LETAELAGAAAPAGLRPKPQCYDLDVPSALLFIVLGIIAFYLVAGVLRYIRQEMQPPRDEKRKTK
jgi:hypothetical protein